MFRIDGRIALLLSVCVAVFGAQPSRASYLQLLDTAGWIENNRVCLNVEDEGTSHSWQSPAYASIANLMTTDGVVAFFDTTSLGAKRVHAVAYDPGDRAYNHWISDSANAYSILTIDSGVVACINGSRGLIQAAAYDPGDRKWHEWKSPALGGVSGFTNTDGVLSCYFSQNQYTWGAAYDMTDKKWHDWLQGPTGTNSYIVNLDSHLGVVTMNYGGKTVAKAYDSGDHAWHTWSQTQAGDSNIMNADAIVAFTHGTYVYGLAYNPGDNGWSQWSTNTNSTVSYVTINAGSVTYLVGEKYSSHFVAEAPRAYFVTVKSSNADSLRYQFLDGSVGGIASWQWTFGDGGGSTERSPMHVYKRPGDYKVTLKVTGTGGSHSRSKTITVPSRQFTLTYKAGEHGSLSGTTTQLVTEGGAGTAVTAVPAKGYHFEKWSDGSMANPRKDSSVAANLTVTATFSNKNAAGNWQLMR